VNKITNSIKPQGKLFTYQSTNDHQYKHQQIGLGLEGDFPKLLSFR
jgi:hypothetical protein